jgi:hypothetical protein
MIQEELTSSKDSLISAIHELRARVDKKKESLLFMKTPYEICTRYLSLKNEIKTLVNKKRKECDREIQNLENQYFDLSKDIDYVEDYMNLSRDLDDQTASLEFMNSFIQRQTMSICQILTRHGFIDVTYEENGAYAMTDLGKIASSINEVHSLVLAQFMVSSQYFKDFDEYQIVGIFSAFTDIKLPDDQRRYNAPDILKGPLNDLVTLIHRYEDDELDDDVVTGIKYDNIINYDMVEISMKWAEKTDELACRRFIQGDVADKGISLGDFNKAMMKIATIGKEVAKVAEEFGHIELLHKLSKIDGLVFKYVTTAQSLYL